MTFEDNGNCFVCSPRNHFGIKAEFTQEEGRAHTRLVLAPEYQGFAGTAHGGIVSALLDEAMFYALSSQGFWGATAELSVRFLHPTPVGQPIDVEARVIGWAHRLGRAEAEIRHEGQLLARAEGKFLATRDR